MKKSIFFEIFDFFEIFGRSCWFAKSIFRTLPDDPLTDHGLYTNSASATYAERKGQVRINGQGGDSSPRGRIGILAPPSLRLLQEADTEYRKVVGLVYPRQDTKSPQKFELLSVYEKPHKGA